jgi:hypothetical protein
MFFPSRSATYTARVPPRSEANAIRLPSGDGCRMKFFAGVLAFAFLLNVLLPTGVS